MTWIWVVFYRIPLVCIHFDLDVSISYRTELPRKRLRGSREDGRSLLPEKHISWSLGDEEVTFNLISTSEPLSRLWGPEPGEMARTCDGAPHTTRMTERRRGSPSGYPDLSLPVRQREPSLSRTPTVRAENADI